MKILNIWSVPCYGSVRTYRRYVCLSPQHRCPKGFVQNGHEKKVLSPEEISRREWKKKKLKPHRGRHWYTGSKEFRNACHRERRAMEQRAIVKVMKDEEAIFEHEKMFRPWMD